MGLHQAFPDAEIVGVDIRFQKNYPFTFVQGDALDFDLSGFDFVWASPPCQGYSRLRHLPWLKGRVYPLLIEPMRRRLLEWGGPWILENVEDAPLLNGVTLCGYSLGLPVYRHRKLEASFGMLAPSHQRHRVVIGHGRMVNDRRRGTLNAGSAAGAWGKQTIVTVAGGQFKKADGERALEIDWMSKDELAQADSPGLLALSRAVHPTARREGSLMPVVLPPSVAHATPFHPKWSSAVGESTRKVRTGPFNNGVVARVNAATPNAATTPTAEPCSGADLDPCASAGSHDRERAAA